MSAFLVALEAGLFGGDGLQAGEVVALVAIGTFVQGVLLVFLAPWWGEAILKAITRREESLDKVVLASVKRQPERLKVFWSGAEMFGPEIVRRDEDSRIAREAAAQVETLTRNIGQLGEIPRQVGRLADAVDRFEGTIDKLVSDSKVHGENLAELRGEVKAWAGPDRRSSTGRRRTDPHE